MKNNAITNIIKKFKSATKATKVMMIVVAVLCLAAVYLVYAMAVYLCTWLAQPRFESSEVTTSSLGFLIQFFIFLGIFLAVLAAIIALIVLLLKKTKNSDSISGGWAVVKKAQDLEECFALRLKVFTDEQHFDPALDKDEIDDYATHIMLKMDGKIVATARIFNKDGDDMIGRICIGLEYRKFGFGRQLIHYAENIMIKNGVTRIVLGAQFHAAPFYEKCGYIRVGEIYLDEGQDHIKMIKNF